MAYRDDDNGNGRGHRGEGTYGGQGKTGYKRQDGAGRKPGANAGYGSGRQEGGARKEYGQGGYGKEGPARRGQGGPSQGYKKQGGYGDRQRADRSYEGRPGEQRPPRPYGEDRPSRPAGAGGQRARAYGDDRQRPYQDGRGPRHEDALRPYGDDRQRPAQPYQDGRGPRPMRPVPPQPAFEGEEAMPRENLLSGRNPIREALKSGRDIERLLVARGELSGTAREIVGMAKERHIVVQTVDRARLDEITQHHQGLIAFASAFRYSTVEDMLALAKEKGEDALLVVLDGVTDPHNLGAIIRTAECAGAHGVIVPERRAVGLTPAAVKASAGAVEHLPVARVGNLSRLLEALKAQGIWVAAADMGGELYTGADLTGPLALVIGAEGSGVSRLVLENADRRVAMPLCGKIDSLNASVAAGVLLYEVRRQRG